MAERTEVGVGVLARAAAILDVVETEPTAAADLARVLGLSLSTAYRLASEMVRYGLLRKDDDGRFALGNRFVTTSMAQIALPVLRRLRDHTGESAQLWLRRGDLRLCAASVESVHELRVTLPVGTTLPLPAGSAGHVLAGDLDKDPRARERGYWVSISERTPGSASVSAPVRTRGEVVAAVCIAAPIDRVGSDPGAGFGPVVVEAAHEIEKTLPSV
ncbi:IclR family transcriptional regulator [Rhodococcus ruber]|uniref:IclR family transcriptional regulator n=1 Tax=Rhodococcus ruber TaxID=1830 RepID=UPI000F53EEDA|nr:IclR family transcriptional regulator [Rhodococcus ruber]RQM35328.1 ArsR family transcriptional regulator [Rhodococcus ruber]